MGATQLSQARTLAKGRLWSFAAVALVWGFLFDWLVNLWMFMFYPLELEYLILIILMGLPFDIAHAVGNFAFAIALGPFVVDNLARARERWSVVYLDGDEMGSPEAPLPNEVIWGEPSE
jgi:hypothetical protein